MRKKLAELGPKKQVYRLATQLQPSLISAGAAATGPDGSYEPNGSYEPDGSYREGWQLLRKMEVTEPDGSFSF